MGERSQELLEDLLDIEVNTLLAEQIRTEKMPALPFALLDVLAMFSQVMVDEGVDLEAYFGPTRAECWARILDHERARGRRGADEAAPKNDKDYIEAARETFLAVHGRAAPSRAELLGGAFDDDLFNCLPDLWPAFPARPIPLRREGARAAELMAGVSNGWDSFERLRIAALVAAPHQRGESGSLVTRVVGAADRLKYVVQRIEQRRELPAERGWFGRPRRPRREVASVAEMIPRTRDALLAGDLRHKLIPPLLDERESRVLRKIWEIGGEHVLVQTSVQIDGDVVTRISRHLLANGEHARALLDAHERGVALGLTNWRALVDAASELVDRLIGRKRR